MHIPDGFLDLRVLGGLAAASAVTVGAAVRKAGREPEVERKVPLLGVVSAFVFAAQMLNFPVAAGTSGHLLGGALSAVLLGPWVGSLVLTTVLIVQALIFQDGGLLALGANIFNMAVVGTIGAYYIYLACRKGLKLGPAPSIAVASWISVVGAAAVTAIELAVSGTVPLPVVLPAMAGVHAIIGVGEAVITVGVVSLVRSVRPDLLRFVERSEAA